MTSADILFFIGIAFLIIASLLLAGTLGLGIALAVTGAGLIAISWVRRGGSR